MARTQIPLPQLAPSFSTFGPAEIVSSPVLASIIPRAFIYHAHVLGSCALCVFRQSRPFCATFVFPAGKWRPSGNPNFFGA